MGPALRTLSLRASPQTGAAIRSQRGNAALMGRRGRRPLHTLSLRASPQTGAAIRFPARQRRADGTSYPKGICSAALHCRTPSPTKSQGVRWKKDRVVRPYEETDSHASVSTGSE